MTDLSELPLSTDESFDLLARASVFERLLNDWLLAYGAGDQRELTTLLLTTRAVLHGRYPLKTAKLYTLELEQLHQNRQLLETADSRHGPALIEALDGWLTEQVEALETEIRSDV